MATVFKKIMIFVMISMMATMPLASSVFAASPDFGDDDATAGAMAADALVVRPFSFVATILGTGLFVIAVPFAALGGNTREAFDALMVKPAKYTFKRPLGEFD